MLKVLIGTITIILLGGVLEYILLPQMIQKSLSPDMDSLSLGEKRAPVDKTVASSPSLDEESSPDSEDGTTIPNTGIPLVPAEPKPAPAPPSMPSASDTSNQRPPLPPAPLASKQTIHAPCVYNHAYQENYKNDSVSAILNEAEDCYVLIDPYEDNSYKQITSLQSKGNSIGCYISVGTGEDWRGDFGVLKPYLAEDAWGEWDGEYFVSQTSPELIQIMKARIMTLAAWGCNYVEFDNMDWAFDDDNRDEYDLKVTQAEAIAYNQELCAYVHTKGMQCMAKNTRQGASMFDGGTYESYTDEKDWWDTSGLKAFLQEGNLGIIVHYDEQNCDAVYAEYTATYGETLSFICEDRETREYKHY